MTFRFLLGFITISKCCGSVFLMITIKSIIHMMNKNPPRIALVLQVAVSPDSVSFKTEKKRDFWDSRGVSAG